MLNRLASFAMSTSVLKALPGKLDIKRHLPSIVYLLFAPLFVGVLCLVLVWLCSTSCPFSFSNHLIEEERANCFT